MLFNSGAFLVFFVAFIFIWPILRCRNNPRWIYLTAASFFFYGWWDWRYLILLAGTGLIDYFAGILIYKLPWYKKSLLIISLLGNIGSLVIFKYLGFFTQNINALLNITDINYSITPVHLILPVGISFYTFQSMSYTIDVYKGLLKPTYNVFHFFAFLSLFPQLVAGPIIRASDLLPQLLGFRKTTESDRWAGMTLIASGYFKKVVIADNLAPVVNAAFGSNIIVDSAAYWWVIMVMFAFQIYCDFSGYSDIARGLAKWMGYEFCVNFNHPYISASIREFWSRWHISLSTWFRDYVYIPLGGSRGSNFAAHKYMWATMLISGFWHGASWTFIIWGGLHALYLSIERITEWPKRLVHIQGGRHVAVVLVFILVLASWVFFRAQSLNQALLIISTMFNISSVNVHAAKSLLSGTAFAAVLMIILQQMYFHFKLDNFENQISSSGMRYALKPVAVGIVLGMCVLFKGPGSAFIYFQF